ncbi:MAG TPA: hydrolase [Rhodobacteraceae bacterium]|nr:hydrolase [Paracoccaceae bacterium]
MDEMEHTTVSIPIAGRDLALPGDLTCPEVAKGLVIFAHGSGSSRMSPRNRAVAAALASAGLATLLFDLLTEPEATDRANVFDIPLLASRVSGTVDWARAQSRLAELNIGLFGASTGAAAALAAAAERPAAVRAVVSRGGRPDLAGDFLERVAAPSLLIVGGADFVVIELNQAAFARLGCVKRLDIIPGAGHLFEEPGALEAVMDRAADWFTLHLERRG